jgi:hypothetical protein
MKVRFNRTIIYEDGEFRKGEIYDVEKKIADRFAEFIEVLKVETDDEKTIKSDEEKGKEKVKK